MKILKVINYAPASNIRKILVGTSSIVISMFPRYDLEKFSKSPLANQQAVYLLYNETVTGNYSIYVGETEEIQQRLQQHDKSVSKQFWTHTMVIQDSCTFLNKAHFKYLEYMLYTYITNAKRGTVVNSSIPVKPRLSEDDTILADEFLDSTREVLLAFNIKFLEPPVIGMFEENPDRYILDHNGCYAALRVNSKNDFILEKGSICIIKPQSECEKSLSEYIKMRSELLASKKARKIEGTSYMEILNDIPFDSENEACAFVTLECLNGFICWKNENGQHLI